MGGTSDNNQRAKFYRLTPAGKKQLDIETSRWDKMSRARSRASCVPRGRPAMTHDSRDEPRDPRDRGQRALDGLDEDIRDHLERVTQENIDRGMTPEEARRQALIAFGNVTLVKEDTRAVWVRVWLEQLAQDVRYALRTLRRSPGFAAIVILTLGLGIGANTAIFSLMDQVLLRALPVERPGELVLIDAPGSFRAAPPARR